MSTDYAGAHRRAVQPHDARGGQSVPGPSHGHLAQLAALRSAGNADAQGVPIQRALENATYDNADHAGAALAQQFFHSCDAATQRAYHFVVNVPSLGAYANLNGHTQRWVRLWNDYVAGRRAPTLAASFGYVVESLVTEVPAYQPAAPGGCTIYPQVPVGGTRPDLVLARGGHHVAWLDLTASESADHIFAKDGWADHIANFAEVTYPSLDAATLALMRQNRNNVGAVSADEFERRRALALAEYRRNKEYWHGLGAGFRKSALRGEAIRTTRMSAEMLELQPEHLQRFIQAKLEQRFHAEIPLQIVPSILSAMNVGSVQWGFRIGTNQSEKTGDVWLAEHAVRPDEPVVAAAPVGGAVAPARGIPVMPLLLFALGVISAVLLLQWLGPGGARDHTGGSS